jgi:NAD(P)-dependent dehydrogenase (short-subunit alcohol dehydrogenase family)
VRSLDQKVAVITGAASGIGLAIARRFVQAGMRVVVADIDQAALDTTCRELGPQTITQLTDVSDEQSVHQLAERAFDSFGTVHVLCNNAGVAGNAPVPIWETPVETWQWVISVNLMGIVHGIRAFVPPMLATGHEGNIVNTASLAGLITFPHGGPYAASKHAAVVATEQLALQLAELGAPINVSVLCPAWVNTRILDDERNRPDHLQVDPTTTFPPTVQHELAASMATAGLDPAVVAEHVVDAILTDRFYVLPNAEWTPAIGERAARIMAGGPIIPPPLPRSRTTTRRRRYGLYTRTPDTAGGACWRARR